MTQVQPFRGAPPSTGAGTTVAAVLTLGVLLTLLLFLDLRRRERRELAEAAADLAKQQVERLQVSILRSMEVLHSVAALHAAEGPLERTRFRAFVRAALERQPELQALSWNPRVLHPDRAAHEARAHHEGVTGFAFLEADNAGDLQVATQRDEYVPVYFIEPQLPNVAALGFDLASDPSRRATLERARDTGEPVATAPVRLAQDRTGTHGVLVLLPLYHGGRPSSVEERRQRLAGFAVAVFRIAALVGTAFEELRRLGLEADLYDESPHGDRIFAFGRHLPAPDAGASASLEVAGRHWALVYTPGPTFLSARPQHGSKVALTVGLAFTLSIGAHLVQGMRRAQAIAAANHALREEVTVRQRAEEAAAAANKAKTDFVTSLSHEIRTPLNAMLGYAQLMLRDTRLPSEARDAVAGIRSGGQHLLGLINEVLDLARIEAGRMELKPVDFDLADLVSAIATTFRPLCHQRHLDFECRLSTSGPEGETHAASTRVHGDEGKLRQVLINLVGNAIKFTRAGRVHLRVRPAPGSPHLWLLEVLDTGLGIPDSEKADIFKPFHQGAGAGHQGGTGLGLAIAQRQVDLLGGRLAFDTERGVGSRFHFSVPLPPATDLPGSSPAQSAPPHANTGRTEAEPASTEPSDPTPTPTPTPPPATITLPGDLVQRLHLAAELHSSTALKSCLGELREHGPDAARLGDELRLLLRGYDMRGIQRTLQRVRSPDDPDPEGRARSERIGPTTTTTPLHDA